ncbi:OmpA family protein [Actinomyces israelii]|uniref:OmpA family protein n=1 Tax=Actinomyces israelii TaxID=1659 RepID=A0ABT4I4M4_9ACTO|nr:OmpA family protein [Actinomyces israelii]MCZ0856691.1 OmpA family protein [Actinomyces israelii]
MGHTDDVADDAHNQKLSEDRAAAVKDRLAQLADLAPWQVTATGKGESEPAVKDATNQARAANRRVVITITPTSGTRNSAAPTAAPSSAPPAAPSSSGAPDGTALPEPKGPVGAGPGGVTAVCTSSGSFVSDEQVTIPPAAGRARRRTPVQLALGHGRPWEPTRTRFCRPGSTTASSSWPMREERTAACCPPCTPTDSPIFPS